MVYFHILALCEYELSQSPIPDFDLSVVSEVKSHGCLTTLITHVGKGQRRICMHSVCLAHVQIKA